MNLRRDIRRVIALDVVILILPRAAPEPAASFSTGSLSPVRRGAQCRRDNVSVRSPLPRRGDDPSGTASISTRRRGPARCRDWPRHDLVAALDHDVARPELHGSSCPCPFRSRLRARSRVDGLGAVHARLVARRKVDDGEARPVGGRRGCPGCAREILDVLASAISAGVRSCRPDQRRDAAGAGTLALVAGPCMITLATLRRHGRSRNVGWADGSPGRSRYMSPDA